MNRNEEENQINQTEPNKAKIINKNNKYNKEKRRRKSTTQKIIPLLRKPDN
ncbi:MAG: hypothetical protein MJA29_07235 [Candidatus Omnitrophica bacterium]|nr:hypothetical protein [Candidatus Omnitrophota bacterium]